MLDKQNEAVVQIQAHARSVQTLEEMIPLLQSINLWKKQLESLAEFVAIELPQLPQPAGATKLDTVRSVIDITCVALRTRILRMKQRINDPNAEQQKLVLCCKAVRDLTQMVGLN